MEAEIKLDLSQISPLTKRLIGSSLYGALIEHFNNPENQKKFKEWQKQRKELKEKEGSV